MVWCEDQGKGSFRLWLGKAALLTTHYTNTPGPDSGSLCWAFPRAFAHQNWEGPHYKAGWGRAGTAGPERAGLDSRPSYSLPRAPGIAARLFSENRLHLILRYHPFSVQLGVHRPFFKKNSRPSFPLHKVLLCKSILDTNRTKTRQKDLVPVRKREKTGNYHVEILRWGVGGRMKTFLFAVSISPFPRAFS